MRRMPSRRRNQVDPSVPQVGEELATARALTDLAKHLTEELPNPRDIVPELSDGIIIVMEKMLAKDREDRYADPGQHPRSLDTHPC